MNSVVRPEIRTVHGLAITAAIVGKRISGDELSAIIRQDRTIALRYSKREAEESAGCAQLYGSQDR